MAQGIAKTCLVIVLCLTGLCGICEEGRHATGFLLPPHRRMMSNETAEKSGSVAKPRKSVLGAADAAKPDNLTISQSDNLTISSLPSRWDSREKGLIGPMKDQGEIDTCWAFATYETLETQMRRLGLGDWDFSEKNMANLHGLTQTETHLGNFDIASAYLLRWGGAVAETNDVYVADLNSWANYPSVPRNPPVHVQNVVWIPLRESASDNATLKAAIMEYGAVAVTMYGTKKLINPANGAYCYDGAEPVDHAVTVVGWDDEYPKENFLTTPAGDGAWIVKNTWGEDYGDRGYLYVSYFDTQFHRNTSMYGTVFLPATADQDYSAVYGYDRLGPVVCDLKGEGGPIGAIFRAAWHEELAAIGLYLCVAPLDYRFSVYTNVSEGAISPISGGILAHEQTGCLTNLGYSTIPLSVPIPLAPGERYSIVFENTSPCDRFFCICSQVVNYADDFTPIEDVTFYKDSGHGWRDSVGNYFSLIYYQGSYTGNICLKAYTRSTVPAKGGEPGETADGSRMCSFVATTNAELYAQSAQTFGAFANIVGDNSRSLWYSWMAGLDPSDPTDDFTVSLSFEDGAPSLSWSPDNIPQRKYTIYGKQSLADHAWLPIEKADVHTSPARFFKVQISTE